MRIALRYVAAPVLAASAAATIVAVTASAMAELQSARITDAPMASPDHGARLLWPILRRLQRLQQPRRRGHCAGVLRECCAVARSAVRNLDQVTDRRRRRHPDAQH